MKLLMFYSPSFWYTTFAKVLEEVPDLEQEEEAVNAVVVFYQAEAEDEGRESKVLNKMLKNIKWLAGKFNTRRVVLHSFGHLSASKAPPGLAQELAGQAAQRLTNTDYQVSQTPFGYLNEWKMHVAGESLAKVFKEI
ncbi:MAG: threonyl-tRNA synthetase editing domain-containing protein [Desulfarculaceae bacterium]|nr:threonyl-tRNA synthetase editing domain-containing protein [Desulfarculaceae bacterium]MCF8072177.1 threonyl-tRNA synthetase editing domain-containing protein [Desulfarculaceae bacterium]MCF8100098.1 threonyl-tRNA synthetase editing domain-containing protein [Desulfarculaceae bacterium]MCF8117927.1 threonyl-tRNA synthetase editing domain-containing protein [Desulfarculaceae bacterium]